MKAYLSIIFLLLCYLSLFMMSCKKEAPLIFRASVLKGKHYGWSTDYYESHIVAPRLDSFYSDSIEIEVLDEENIEVQVWGDDASLLTRYFNLESQDTIVFNTLGTGYGSINFQELIYCMSSQSFTYQDYSFNNSMMANGFEKSIRTFYVD